MIPRIRVLSTLLLFLCCSSAIYAGGIGTWRNHLSYHNPTRSEQAGNLLYVVANGGLYTYDKQDNSIRTYCKSFPLSDTDVSYIAYQPTHRTLLIVYSNANIDLLVNEEDVYNLSDYRDKQMTASKKVNSVCFDANHAYLATASGILAINLQKREISNHYTPDVNILACNVADGRIYACTRTHLYQASLTDNLQDKNVWTRSQEGVAAFLNTYKDVPFKAEIPENITPDSPLRNFPYSLSFAGERLLVAGGGHIANRLNRPGTIMTFEQERWKSFQEEGIKAYTGHNYLDINCVVQNPEDDTHHFAASAGEGIYEFRNGKLVDWHSMHNSPLESAVPNSVYSPNYVRVNGLAYDKLNNLWMVSCETEHQVTVFTNNRQWISLSYPEIREASNFGRTIFDRRGWLWATSSRIESGGLFCLDTNGSIADSSDDRHRFITRFTNQDGTLLEQLAVYCCAEDKNGAIWIGTNKGPLVINSPTRFFNSDFYCTQVKVPRNDGTNLADFLLVNQAINSIAVDGANRKWIGTATNGIYLLNEDGTETIRHFTAKNSPLLSNSIESIAIHPRTGEVFIGTSKGLVSYQSDATEAQNEFIESQVEVYPNPLRPEYDGVVTVTGMVYDSDVKITDISGRLVFQGKSLGGMFTWDGRNQQGKRVASGIYMVLASDPEGKTGIVAKIAVVR